MSWRETNSESVTSAISQVTNSVFPDLAPCSEFHFCCFDLLGWSWLLEQQDGQD